MLINPAESASAYPRLSPGFVGWELPFGEEENSRSSKIQIPRTLTGFSIRYSVGLFRGDVAPSLRLSQLFSLPFHLNIALNSS